MIKQFPRDIALMMVGFIITWVDRNSSFNLPPLLQSFLADLFCIPIILFCALIILRYLKNNREFLFPVRVLIFVFVWISLLCEILIPAMSSRYTADWWDVLMYAAGSLYVLLRQKNWTSSPPENKTALT